MRRLLRFTGVLLLVLVGVAALGAGALVWRLQRGPLPLDVLVPRIAASLAEGDDAWRVEVDGLELAWQPSERHAELRARGLRVARPDGSASVRLEAVRLRLRRRALLRGEIAVAAIELQGPDLRLVRDAGGRFGLGVGTASGETRDLGWLSSALGRLEHVSVRDGRIAFVDEASRTTFSIAHVDGDAWRTGGPLRVEVGVTLAAGDGTVPIWLSGIYRFEAGTLDLDVSTPGADTATAFAAWPASLASEAHAWVTTRLSGGRIGSSVLHASGHVVEGEDGQKLVVDGFGADVAFEGLSVRYVDTMPAATGVGGVARFTRDDVKIAVDGGRLEALALGPSSVHVAWPPDAPNRIAITATARGPLASLVGVLAHEPVALAERIPFPTKGITGTVATRVRFAFPLEGRPTFGKLGLRANATLRDTTVPDVAGRWSVTRGAAEVVVDDRAVEITGTADLEGVPIRLRFEDRLGRGHESRLEVASRLDGAGRAALGLSTGDWLTGPVEARLRLATERDGRNGGDVDVDLAPAAIDLPSLALRKPASAPGRALARLVLAGGAVAAVKQFQLTTESVAIRGSAGRAAGGGAWDRIDAVAELGPPDRRGGMRLGLGAGEGDRWNMSLTSGDVGLLLGAYGYENATGGTLAVEGTLGLGIDGLPFDGRLTVERVTLTRVPWLVKAVSLASLRGLLDVGSEQSIDVDRAVATLAHRPPGTIEIRDAVARGPKLGLNLTGTVAHVADTLDISGTLVPSYYMLNEGVARIPVVGGVLGKMTGGALQAVTFTARGPRGDPVVSVQPLSSLAPGVTREWLRKLGL